MYVEDVSFRNKESQITSPYLESETPGIYEQESPIHNSLQKENSVVWPLADKTRNVVNKERNSSLR